MAANQRMMGMPSVPIRMPPGGMPLAHRPQMPAGMVRMPNRMAMPNMIQRPGYTLTNRPNAMVLSTSRAQGTVNQPGGQNTTNPPFIKMETANAQILTNRAPTTLTSSAPGQAGNPAVYRNDQPNAQVLTNLRPTQPTAGPSNFQQQGYSVKQTPNASILSVKNEPVDPSAGTSGYRVKQTANADILYQGGNNRNPAAAAATGQSIRPGGQSGGSSGQRLTGDSFSQFNLAGPPKQYNAFNLPKSSNQMIAQTAAAASTSRSHVPQGYARGNLANRAGASMFTGGATQRMAQNVQQAAVGSNVPRVSQYSTMRQGSGPTSWGQTQQAYRNGQPLTANAGAGVRGGLANPAYRAALLAQVRMRQMNPNQRAAAAMQNRAVGAPGSSMGNVQRSVPRQYSSQAVRVRAPASPMTSPRGRSGSQVLQQGAGSAQLLASIAAARAQTTVGTNVGAPRAAGAGAQPTSNGSLANLAKAITARAYAKAVANFRRRTMGAIPPPITGNLQPSSGPALTRPVRPGAVGRLPVPAIRQSMLQSTRMRQVNPVGMQRVVAPTRLRQPLTRGVVPVGRMFGGPRAVRPPMGMVRVPLRGAVPMQTRPGYVQMATAGAQMLAQQQRVANQTKDGYTVMNTANADILTTKSPQPSTSAAGREGFARIDAPNADILTTRSPQPSSSTGGAPKEGYTLMETAGVQILTNKVLMNSSGHIINNQIKEGYTLMETDSASILKQQQNFDPMEVIDLDPEPTPMVRTQAPDAVPEVIDLDPEDDANAGLPLEGGSDVQPSGSAVVLTDASASEGQAGENCEDVPEGDAGSQESATAVEASDSCVVSSEVRSLDGTEKMSESEIAQEEGGTEAEEVSGETQEEFSSQVEHPEAEEGTTQQQPEESGEEPVHSDMESGQQSWGTEQRGAEILQQEAEALSKMLEKEAEDNARESQQGLETGADEDGACGTVQEPAPTEQDVSSDAAEQESALTEENDADWTEQSHAPSGEDGAEKMVQDIAPTDNDHQDGAEGQDPSYNEREDTGQEEQHLDMDFNQYGQQSDLGEDTSGVEQEADPVVMSMIEKKIAEKIALGQVVTVDDVDIDFVTDKIVQKWEQVGQPGGIIMPETDSETGTLVQQKVSHPAGDFPSSSGSATALLSRDGGNISLAQPYHSGNADESGLERSVHNIDLAGGDLAERADVAECVNDNLYTSLEGHGVQYGHGSDLLTIGSDDLTLLSHFSQAQDPDVRYIKTEEGAAEFRGHYENYDNVEMNTLFDQISGDVDMQSDSDQGADYPQFSLKVWTFRCHVCSGDFKSMHDLATHCKDAHGIEAQFHENCFEDFHIQEDSCADDSVQFKENCDVPLGQVAPGSVPTGKGNQYRCNKCGWKFANHYSLRRHRSTNCHGFQGFRCPKCDKVLRSLTKYIKHKRGHRGSGASSDED